MASAHSRHIRTFIQSIAPDVRLYRQLLQLLQTQNSLYFAFDGEALNQNLREQLPLYSQLQESASVRSGCLQALKLPADEQSVKRIFNALPPALKTQVEKQWAVLNTLIHQCHAQNQENGQCSAQFHEMLTQLTQPSPTYDPHLNGL
ncbi:flagellar export chaperone FlgN [Vibrio quintilis]|uniref:FlgN protein n=1 Tax=Vibrio quintilis TaxID=1117707 RepID=A0A1M7YSR3_9VIBR|nr:flagellar export chaperone FlgN [Vibrio quintilis]SHO55662.1 FlgN protein [Vibrio quintilis]